MNQIKIGDFIAEKRKAKDMTQSDVAQKLCVTDRAVSKWECGKGMPDVSLMMPLCELLGITLNELLCGEAITEQDLAKQAENQVFDLLQERQANTKKAWLARVVVCVGLTVVFGVMLLAAYIRSSAWLITVLIIFGAVIFVVCVIVGLMLDYDAVNYECRNCRKRFVPSFKSYVWGSHTSTKKKLKCPHCQETTWCKRKLTKA